MAWSHACLTGGMTFFRRLSRSSLPISSIVVAVPALCLLITLQACMGSLAGTGASTCTDGTDCSELRECDDDGYGYGYGYGYGGKNCRD